ncbi:uncharacterized protein LOC117793870 [Drosophila innubila]|uniref:uncharacterized protein LOC117793870 n=1 Tax=Drosophila innubila TaxID=198719 RepID=UPI00148D4314|nr:uncharacterized protein LOC117793870 [Drosophila innubila]XP_034490194.1 uncharacterized protein LOC117793870 [Drosophila innubila]
MRLLTSTMPQLFPLLLHLLLLMPVHVTARFCEGGHICSLPRECCTQGCCPPYQGGPRELTPPSEHVLNLFFISHWFFWCVVVAVILAILCAYSLWKKRRTLCGWGFTEHHTQSEGDSAGSCYAPPQYSRCNSFHHPPPPYTEVTSKPDLYPLVFTCNSENSKGNVGSSYLMVQYFRNYIIRPTGSLSATSTVDSLSSSFICNANEANTLVPPPYSRAASPELSLQYVNHRELPSNSQLAAPQYGLPRSASQLVEMEYQPPQAYPTHYATIALDGVAGIGAGPAHYSTRLHTSHSGHFSSDGSVGESANEMHINDVSGGFLQSHSDQHFRYMANSTSSLSDIFVNNSCAVGLGDTTVDVAASGVATQAPSLCSLAAGTTQVIYSNGCIQPNPLHNLVNSCQLTTTVEAAATATAPTTNSIVSGVSSLSNIGTPGSPPQPTSPTGEEREVLNQIRQLQAGVSYDRLLLTDGVKHRFQHTMSTPITRPSTLQQHQQITSVLQSTATAPSKSKKLYASKSPNKALYIPMAAIAPPSSQRCVLKSPVSSVVYGASFILNRGRVARKGWISRSAPSTPGSGLPPNRLGDDSPLLNEHDEDAIDEAHGEQLE